VVSGGPDRDDLRGDGGNDVLRGGAEADRCQGGSGRDRCDGGPPGTPAPSRGDPDICASDVERRRNCRRG
jgi:hypothetical protein